jgi:hypothetical protein
VAYADDVNLLGDYMDTIRKNRETSKEDGLEINIEKSIGCCLLTRKQVNIRA